MSITAPAFHCKKCLSKNFVWYESCLVCNHTFSDDDIDFKVTQESSVRGISTFHYSPYGFPVENREFHVLEKYKPENDKILVKNVCVEFPAIDRFSKNEQLKYDLHNEREKNEKLKRYLSWLSFTVLLGIMYIYNR
ncbi:hypothetical protein [Desulfosediminicola flagellatus]|uniref:hypothetical protein n=1 Tax=Desulfosediminicola flagellatus TaxID=2569541 RepID=UPI0010AD61D9|nr:hypothetical protein [Desulfosediminicola flagellatus]